MMRLPAELVVLVAIPLRVFVTTTVYAAVSVATAPVMLKVAEVAPEN